MQPIAAHEYDYLAELARRYRDVYLPKMKQMAHFNPQLGIDALCFQRVEGNLSGDQLMVGALITPCELWLVAVPDQLALQTPFEERTLLTLPSGRYELSIDRLPGDLALYKRPILEDLGNLESMQEAARLAQRMMERLMTVAPSSQASQH